MPPLALTVALPVLPPKQLTLVCEKMPAESAAVGCVMSTVRVVWQPFASFTVAVQLPAGRPAALRPLWGGTVFQFTV